MSADIPAQEAPSKMSKLDLFNPGPRLRQNFKQETTAAETVRVCRGYDLSAGHGVHSSSWFPWIFDALILPSEQLQTREAACLLMMRPCFLITAVGRTLNPILPDAHYLAAGALASGCCRPATRWPQVQFSKQPTCNVTVSFRTEAPHLRLHLSPVASALRRCKVISSFMRKIMRQRPSTQHFRLPLCLMKCIYHSSAGALNARLVFQILWSLLKFSFNKTINLADGAENVPPSLLFKWHLAGWQMILLARPRLQMQVLIAFCINRSC